ncbi:hypothetical protein [Kitasatospora sp. GAS1066B]|uniref:hypothetical protein n=1 Tax=Kitasatospora sp. GAS1066B TaxID=3156271 RepID=UPI0035129FCA
MHVMERATARWIPPEGTVEAVAAGQFWDAVAVPQYIGLAALEILDQPSRPRLGPVIWDSSGRPRMYFLIPLSSPLSWTHERLLAAGSFVTVPGRTALGLPGPFWIVPPDPDDPGALVDACLLRRARDLMRTAAVAESPTTWPPSSACRSAGRTPVDPGGLTADQTSASVLSTTRCAVRLSRPPWTGNIVTLHLG